MVINMNYSFIPYDRKTGIVNIKDINDTQNVFAAIFLSEVAETAYVVDDKNHLLGLVTPSDLEHLYYSDEGSLKGIINTNFSFLDEIDNVKAQSFFERYKKCHEIPVISDGQFTGVLFDGIGKSSAEWAEIKNDIKKRSAMEADIKWYCNSIKKQFRNHHADNLLIYGNLRRSDVVGMLAKEEIDAFFRRKGLTNKQIYKEILNAWWSGEKFFDDYEKISFVLRRGVLFPKDMQTKCINISNHHRVVPDKPTKAERRVFMVGPCNVFGAYVTDSQTIEAHLQKELNENCYCDIEVVNCGLMGPEKCLDNIFVSDISANDIVVIITPGFDWVFKECFPKSYRGCLSDVYKDIENPTQHFLDNVRHCDGVVNKAVADRIWIDLKDVLDRKIEENPTKLFGAKYFIPPEVNRYFDGYMEEFFDDFHCDGKVGAIVMNCNPFTNGHGYLVEYASSKVDQLIIFVVEEDKSFFTFEQRFEMVKRGVEDISNVIVVPSGRYIISKETFAQYFDKENAIEVDDMDYDIYVFGDVVASRLGITTRFLGNEPTDIVTNRYNERMQEILPSFGIDVEIIERKTDGAEVISGSRVRENFNNDNWEEVRKLCPESTVTILKKIKEKADI